MSPVWILLTLLPVLGGAERFNCKGRILGAYYADVKSGCKAFHVCVRVAGGGVHDFRFFCPPGTLFHQEAQTCTDWGDDDPLACPADIYDGQFDLYRIGSGFDTKKSSSNGNRVDDPEFGLQRAETGDRRLNNAASNKPDSDLRAAHSSDFFSGQRDRGRDDSSQSVAAASPSPSPQSHSRQSFRRPTTPRPSPTTQNTYPTTQRTYPTTQYVPSPTTPSQSSHRPHHDGGSKRKLVRKRPIYVSTNAPSTTLAPITSSQQNNPDSSQQTQQNFIPQQTQQNFESQQTHQNFNPQQTQQNFNPQQTQQNFNPQQNFPQEQSFINQQYFKRRISPRPSTYSTTPNVPPQFKEYKDEYVEVSRVTPKQRFFHSSSPSSASPLSTQAQKYYKKESLVELYNYDSQSTPGLNVQNDNAPFKVKNSFTVSDVQKDRDFPRAKSINFSNAREPPTTTSYSITTRGFPNTTPVYQNYNSVSYETEKNNFDPYSKQNNNYPTTTAAPIISFSTTVRPPPPLNLNTVAYDTNNGFDVQSNEFGLSDEDDGQYHPPQGEDDGQYRPELYDRELLTGAHSLNIAASGNRLQEEQKSYSKAQSHQKPVAQTSAPRPFRPAPTPSNQPTTRVPETYTTTPQPQTVNTQRAFDFIQTYTTTSRPVDFGRFAQTFAPETPTRTTTLRTLDTRPPRPTNREPAPSPQPSSAPPRPNPRPNFAKPANNKEDNSYDYAYYDSDPGFTEYDHIEEFGRTNKKNT